MSKEISELVIQSEETIRAAMEINNALGAVKGESWNLFKGVVLDKVKERIPGTIKYEEDGWYAISVPVMKGAYTLYVDYDWRSISVVSEGKEKSPAIEKSINEVMTALTGVPGAKTNFAWDSGGVASYPGMEHTEKALYPYLLYKKYKENPQEAANHILAMANLAMANELDKI